MKKILSAMVLSAFAMAAQAGPITSGVWYTWGSTQDGTGVAGTPGYSLVGGTTYADSPSWTFSGAGIFEVLDAFAMTDTFDVFDGAALVGSSGPATFGTNCGSNLAACIAESSGYGAFALGAGNHSITIQRTGGSSGAHLFRYTASASVPEPGTLGLLGMGLLGLGFARKTRKA